MTDRELLEDAAKAAGIEVWWNGRTCFVLKTKVATHEWNPLTDDGDALRLAVKLGLSVTLGKNATSCIINGESLPLAINNHNGDPYAATRRAIVRSAAEIGRSMT